MNAQRFLLLRSDIDRECKQLEKLVEEYARTLGEKKTPSPLELRGIGSILHDFYCGIERIFERIAIELDGDLPHGRDWHGQLLERMSVAVESVRPQVISPELAETLRDYLRFRHLFRNVYGFDLRWEKFRELADGMSDMLTRFQKEMDVFKEVLMALYKNCQ